MADIVEAAEEVSEVKPEVDMDWIAYLLHTHVAE